MIKLYGGDKQFSSWSMRAYILLEESKLDYDYKMIGLDWPVKYHENGDIEIITGDNDYEIPKEPASGCGCQLTQILKNDSTGLIKNSFSKFLPRVPILIDTTNNIVISDILVMEQYLRDFHNINLLSDNKTLQYEILTFCSHIHADLLPLMSEMSFSNSFRSPNKSDIGEVGITQLNETLSLLNNILNKYEKSFLFDDNLTFADIMFAPIAKQIDGWNIEIRNSKIREYINVLLNHYSIKKYISEAKQFYDNIDNSIVDSPKWIVSHYRYHTDLKMLNNPKYDVYHILDNSTAELFYSLAVKDHSKTDIINFVSTKFNVDKDTIKQDVEDFFKLLHPNSLYKDKLKDA